jgi:hypothetical protein
MMMLPARERRKREMNDLESQEATAQEFIAFAKERGFDLSSMCHDWAFLNEGRFLSLWRKDGTLGYNMQGAVSVLPGNLRASARAFQGVWSEAGTFENMEQAFRFLKAWLLDRNEVDDLPS